MDLHYLYKFFQIPRAFLCAKQVGEKCREIQNPFKIVQIHFALTFFLSCKIYFITYQKMLTIHLTKLCIKSISRPISSLPQVFH